MTRLLRSHLTYLAPWCRFLVGREFQNLLTTRTGYFSSLYVGFLVQYVTSMFCYILTNPGRYVLYRTSYSRSEPGTRYPVPSTRYPVVFTGNCTEYWLALWSSGSNNDLASRIPCWWASSIPQPVNNWQLWITKTEGYLLYTCSGHSNECGRNQVISLLQWVSQHSLLWTLSERKTSQSTNLGGQPVQVIAAIYLYMKRPKLLLDTVSWLAC